jgi:hypothetical protein
LDDNCIVIVNENLIREALLKSKPADMEKILTAVEAYRTCVSTARRLVHNRSMDTQRQQVMDCAHFCEEKLAGYAATGKLGSLRYPEPDRGCAHIVIAIEW